MALQSAVERVFDANGLLAKLFDHYKPRAGQTHMALEVARTMESGGVLVAEAGTGIGKTFAYLVPALLSEHKVLLSTATKTLQDQLFSRDIPRLLTVLGLPARIALLKGRSSYLCLHRMEYARHDPRANGLDAMRHLARIEAWSLVTRTGDMAELAGVEEGSPVFPLVTSTRDNCVGAQCPKATQCHVNRARREALVADMVVINHHLFFADVNVRESGVAELLPTVRSVIFDEAHQMNDIGVQFLGQQLTTGQLSGFCRDLSVLGPQWAPGLTNWPLMAIDFDRAIAALRNIAGAVTGTSSRPWVQAAPQGISPHRWSGTMHGLHMVMADVSAVLSRVAEASFELKKLYERVQHFQQLIEGYATPVKDGYVRWVELGPQVRLMESPLDIGQAMRDKVFTQDASIFSAKSWIFTSATLGTNASMSWFVDSCGLGGARLLQVQSPFDYATQACMAIPEHMPKPSDPTHSAAVAALAAHGASILGGRTLVLTTTLRAMGTIGDGLRQHYCGPHDLEVLVQGQASKHELVRRFCAGNSPGGRGCVMVASASFWEGVDIPGDALQLLIIDKLPFAPPEDPVMQARAQKIEARGENPFHSFQVPQAAIALKQGVGRLIRSETDKGVVVICDVRLTQMTYGRKMLAALPTMPCLTTQGHLTDALRRLTRVSTTGQPLTP